MTTRTIKKIGVIGAGTMGRGIAAQAANAGVEVVLLDKFEGKADKEVQAMLAAKPTDAFNAGFMHPDNAKLIKTGTTDANLNDLADCDWIVVSILAPKHIRAKVYKDIQRVAKKDAIISDNTSMDQTTDMIEGQDEDFRKRFLNTHFFNPVRFMHLLEVIPGKDTDPDIVAAVSDFGDKKLGKKVVLCKDERGFIANRIGVYAIERAMAEAIKQGTNIEDVDALMGKAFGFPHLGLFKLADEVGLDVVDHVRSDFHKTLPQTDAFQKTFSGNEDLQQMLKDGYVGNRKSDSKGGFYRLKRDDKGTIITDAKGKPVKESRDLLTKEYRPFAQSPFYGFEKQIKKLGGYQKFFDSDHAGAKFTWPVMRDLMLYVLDHAEELAYDLQSVDDAMRAGFNWDYGPFELMDKVGIDWLKAKLAKDGIAVPALLQKAQGNFYRTANKENQVMGFDGKYAAIKREPGLINLSDIKVKSKPLVTHNSASLWDIGDGVVCLEFHSMQNTIDPSVLWVLNESIKLVNDSNGKYKGMVVYNDGMRFSLGANLKLAEVFMSVAENKWDGLAGKQMGAWLAKIAPGLGLPEAAERGLKGLLHELLFQGQAVYTALHQASFPVVGAPKGQLPKSASEANMAVGGGLEILLNCDAVQSGPEQVMALPEVGIGILPAWTGSTRYLQRAFEKTAQGKVKGPMISVIKAAEALVNPLASGAASAQDARTKMWLRAGDGITMNPDRVLSDAKAKVLAMAPGYKPEPLPTFNLPGLAGKGAIRMNVDKLYLKGDPPAKGGVNHVDVRVADRLADVLTGGETLEYEEVDSHAAAHHEHIKRLIDEKEKGYLDVNPSIVLTWNRMMQLERDNAMSAFDDKKHVWPRVHAIVDTNNYLREDRPNPAPTPDNLRSTAYSSPLPRRDITGQPLTGDNARKLKAMADMTTEFYRQFTARGLKSTLGQAVKTLQAVKQVFKLV